MLLVPFSEAKPFWTRGRRRRCSSSRPSGVAWVNSWRQYFSTDCPSSYSVTFWQSEHRNCKEDRIHYFQCGYGPVRYRHGNCAWSGHYVNDFDQLVNYKCPHNGFITGVRSVYSGHHRDRRFNFRCCHVSGLRAHSCQTTLYQNQWDKEIRYQVPNGYFLVGVTSVHHNRHEDRRYKFEICQFSRVFGK